MHLLKLYYYYFSSYEIGAHKSELVNESELVHCRGNETEFAHEYMYLYLIFS
jgi:hypothetical protein